MTSPENLESTAHVLLTQHNNVGQITLRRPQALNALSHSMVLTIEAALLSWRENDDISCVLIDAEGVKAFCAGGDVTALYEQGRSGEYESGRQFWRDEYRLNRLIDGYAKPYIAVMDGIVMGGGIGISAHGSHRIVTERSSLALPECAIGLVPDVGSTHLLSRAPESIGEYLALTGARFSAADALHIGFADFFVPSDKLQAMKAAIIDTGDVSVINDISQTPGHSELAGLSQQIHQVFSTVTVDAVIELLRQSEEDWAQSALKKIERSSPLSLVLSVELIGQARAQPGLAKALAREFRFVSQAMQYSDFLEGVRAALIDKDRNPRWMRSITSTVTDNDLKPFRDVAPGGDLIV